MPMWEPWSLRWVSLGELWDQTVRGDCEGSLWGEPVRVFCVSLWGALGPDCDGACVALGQVYRYGTSL